MVNSYFNGIPHVFQDKTTATGNKSSVTHVSEADNYNNFIRLKENNKDIYKASDGQEYNIMEIILSRILILNRDSAVYDRKYELVDKIIGSKKADQIFESQTGKKYTPQNIELFLKGELELLAEKNASPDKREKIGKFSNPPYIRDDCSEKNQTIKSYENKKVLNATEKTLYAKIYGSLDKVTQKKFEKCLNSGKLLQRDSNNKTSVLDNLYKIFSTPRAPEVNKQTILKECIDILDNPLRVTQITEDIPDKYMGKASEYVFSQEESIRRERKEISKSSSYMQMLISESGEENINKKDELERIRKALEDRDVGTCVAASIEFAFASKHPAEFIRIIEGLTSPKKEVKKFINCKEADLTDDYIEYFKTENRITDGKMELTLRADDGAYILADIQKKCQDDDERTTLDILFQSLVFQTATKGTYNSISDKHSGLYHSIDGLNSIEENYVLQILTGKQSEENIYNDNETDEPDKNLIEKDIEEALDNGKFLLVGINILKDSEIVDSHELTVIGKINGLDGAEYYICKDTYEYYPRPVLVKKEYLLECILSINVIN